MSLGRHAFGQLQSEFREFAAVVQRPCSWRNRLGEHRRRHRLQPRVLEQVPGHPLGCTRPLHRVVRADRRDGRPQRIEAAIERLDMVAETRRIGRVELLRCAALALTATLTAEGIRTSSPQVIDPAKSFGERS